MYVTHLRYLNISVKNPLKIEIDNIKKVERHIFHLAPSAERGFSWKRD